MKIVICGSIEFAEKMFEAKSKIEALSHSVRIPYTAEKILKGEITLEEIKNNKDQGTQFEFSIKNDAIRRWYEVIKEGDAILVLNLDKKGIVNYIGGNVFLEIGFAHILNKKKFLLNPIPDLPYSDEIRAMEPVILDGDFSKII